MTKSNKVPSRLIGVFDYTYEDGVEHFKDSNRDYVVLYELRTPDVPQIEESRNVYDRLYIYPVTKESFKRYWESDEQDPSVLELSNTTYTFNNPSTEIYPKPEDKVISGKQALTFNKENIGSLIQNALFYKYGYAPAIALSRIYLKDGLLRIPDEFYCSKPNSYLNFQIHTLTSNNLEDSEEGLPNSVEVIGRCAFANSRYRFKSLPTNLKEVGTHAFAKCVILIRALPENAVFNKYSLYETKVSGLSYIDVEKHFPNGLDSARFCTGFSYDNELELKLNKGCRSRFFSCTFSSNLRVTEDDVVIPNFCFDDCIFYKIVSISGNVEKIKTHAFHSCETVQYCDTPRLRELFEDVEKREEKSFSHFKAIPNK